MRTSSHRGTERRPGQETGQAAERGGMWGEDAGASLRRLTSFELGWPRMMAVSSVDFIFFSSSSLVFGMS